jgi:hypothetical protein
MEEEITSRCQMRVAEITPFGGEGAGDGEGIDY